MTRSGAIRTMTRMTFAVLGLTLIGGMTGGAALAQERTPGELDITGQAGTPPKEYIVLPVPRGDLKVAKEHSLKNSTVKGSDGKKVGRLERLILDSKTGKIEYGVISLKETKRLVPLAWSAFNVNRMSGEVTLNATEEQLRPDVNPTLTKDLSPAVTQLVKEMEVLREREPRKAPAREGLGITERPAAGGPHGEEAVGGAGPSGPRALPPGKAPGFEEETNKSK